MTDIDTRLIAFLVWGAGTVVVYAVVLIDRWHEWRHWRDARAKRNVLTAIGLFLTALGAGGAVTLVLFGEAGSGLRGMAIAISLGAFFATGLIMATTRPRTT